jgi:hypothetical protein
MSEANISALKIKLQIPVLDLDSTAKTIVDSFRKQTSDGSYLSNQDSIPSPSQRKSSKQFEIKHIERRKSLFQELKFLSKQESEEA